MNIDKTKFYKVMKYTTNGETNYGKMRGADVKSTIEKCKCEYDSFFGMFYNKDGSVGFKIYEV